LDDHFNFVFKLKKLKYKKCPITFVYTVTDRQYSFPNSKQNTKPLSLSLLEQKHNPTPQHENNNKAVSH